jgi:hypothetical protein
MTRWGDADETHDFSIHRGGDVSVEGVERVAQPPRRVFRVLRQFTGIHGMTQSVDRIAILVVGYSYRESSRTSLQVVHLISPVLDFRKVTK